MISESIPSGFRNDILKAHGVNKLKDELKQAKIARLQHLFDAADSMVADGIDRGEMQDGIDRAVQRHLDLLREVGVAEQTVNEESSRNGFEVVSRSLPDGALGGFSVSLLASETPVNSRDYFDQLELGASPFEALTRTARPSYFHVDYTYTGDGLNTHESVEFVPNTFNSYGVESLWGHRSNFYTASRMEGYGTVLSGPTDAGYAVAFLMAENYQAHLDVVEIALLDQNPRF